MPLLQDAGVRPLPDGWLEVDLEVADPRWLIRLLLRLAPHADVVAPRVHRIFRNAAEQTLASTGTA